MKKWIFIIFAVCLLSACNDDSDGSGDKVAIENMVTLPLADESQWTYFSFAKGSIVGYSAFDSEEEDRQWASRNDWDIAFCGERMKTNSGTSGQGNGGVIYHENITYDEATEAPASGYSIDVETPLGQ